MVIYSRKTKVKTFAKHPKNYLVYEKLMLDKNSICYNNNSV